MKERAINRQRAVVAHHHRLARQLPPTGGALRPLADGLSRVLSYRLLHDHLTEGFEIACKDFIAGCFGVRWHFRIVGLPEKLVRVRSPKSQRMLENERDVNPPQK